MAPYHENRYRAMKIGSKPRQSVNFDMNRRALQRDNKSSYFSDLESNWANGERRPPTGDRHSDVTPGRYRYYTSVLYAPVRDRPPAGAVRYRWRSSIGL